MIVELKDAETIELIERYVDLLQLPTSDLQITTYKPVFERWLGRRVTSTIGGAYTYSYRQKRHLVFINLQRIDRTKPRSLEIVVAEELIHMRDRLDGDLRRHSKHGYDRIAYRVAALTGASLEEVRSCLIPREARPYRYLYACPRCSMSVRRRHRGTWSCGRCSRKFDPKLVLTLVRDDLHQRGSSAIGVSTGQDETEQLKLAVEQ